MGVKSFEKKIKKSSKKFPVPNTYHKKADEILEMIQENSVSLPRSKPFVKMAIIMAALCLIIIGYFCFSESKCRRWVSRKFLSR